MKARLLMTMSAAPEAPDEICTFEDGKRFVLEGQVIDHPDSYKLVHGGFAEPADEECEAKVKTLPKAEQGLAKQVHTRIMADFKEFQDDLEEEEEYDSDDEGDDE